MGRIGSTSGSGMATDPQASVLVDRDVMVEMRDGTALATDVYRPVGDGRHPVLLQRTPYGKSNARLVGDLMFNPLSAVERGYAVVVQDARGRFGSRGCFEPYKNEFDDGYDAVEWAASQPWSSGRIGVYGSSFVGLLALHAAVAAPPHLEAVLTCFTGANLHRGWAHSGGALELGFSLRLARVLAADTLARALVPAVELHRLEQEQARLLLQPLDTARQLPLDALPAFQLPELRFWRDWLQHPAYDDYWASRDGLARIDALRVPLLHVTGWYDIFLRGHLDLHERLGKHPDERVRHEHRLIVGPWDHSAYMSLRPSASGEIEFGPDARNGTALIENLAYRWFGRWLRGDEQPPQADSVRYFDVGTRRWHADECWPPNGLEVRLYLSSDGRANTRSGDGRLIWEPPVADPPDQFVYDPDDPVPTVGGRIMQVEFGPGGIQDQASVEDRPDILVYTTQQLGTALTVAGPVHARLTISTDAADTDFTAKLVDVGPSGYCAIIADGIARLRYQDSDATEAFHDPGDIRPVTIDLVHIAYTFAPTHRIRLEVSSSNFPRFDRNLNSRVTPAVGSAADLVVATQTVWHDRMRPSYLALWRPAEAG